MGCGTSRMEPGEAVPSGMLPFRRRREEAQRRRRERKDSIVSTTELLRPEERDADECDHVAGDENESTGGESANSSTKEDGEEGRMVGFGRERTQDLPGSPSFRFYFADSVAGTHDDGRTGAVQAQMEEIDIKSNNSLQEKKEDRYYLVSRESCELKAPKKEKGKKFMALHKAMSLNVRGCYHVNSSTLHDQESQKILNEKVV